MPDDHVEKKDYAFTFGLTSLIVGFISPYLVIASFLTWLPPAFLFAGFIACIPMFVIGLVFIWLSRKSRGMKFLLTFLPLIIWLISAIILSIAMLFVPGIGAPR